MQRPHLIAMIKSHHTLIEQPPGTKTRKVVSAPEVCDRRQAEVYSTAKKAGELSQMTTRAKVLMVKLSAVATSDVRGMASSMGR